MAFVNYPLDFGAAGRSVSGLDLTKTAALTLEVAAGSVTEHGTGTTHTLASAESHVFAADSTNPTQVLMAIISDDGSNVDLWVDAFVDDGTKSHADPPAGFRVVHDVAWFTLAAGETDLDNATINRRTAA